MSNKVAISIVPKVISIGINPPVKIEIGGPRGPAGDGDLVSLLPTLTSGSVLFSDGTTIGQDNSNLFWDDVNKKLGIGIPTPGSILSIKGDIFTKGGITLKDTNASSSPRTFLRYDGTGDGIGDGFVPPFVMTYNNAYDQNLPFSDDNANYTAFIGFNPHDIEGSNSDYGTIGISMEAHYDYGTELHLVHNYDSATTGATRFITYKGRDDGTANTLGLSADVIGLRNNAQEPKVSLNTVTNILYISDLVKIVSEYEGEPFIFQKTGTSTRPFPYWIDSDTLLLGQSVTITGSGGEAQINHPVAFSFASPYFMILKNSTNSQVLTFDAPSNNRVHKLYAQSDGRMDWMVDPTGISPTPVFTITSDKRIGINSNSPNYRLEVVGTVNGVALAVTSVNLPNDQAIQIQGNITGAAYGFESNLGASSGLIFNFANRSSHQYARSEVLIQNSSTSGIGESFTRYLSTASDWSVGTRRDNQSYIIARGAGLGSTPDLSISYATGNVGIGVAAANASAILDITSTTKAFMPPRMTTTQKNAIASPVSGMLVYDDTLKKLCVYGASSWETITSV